MAVGFITQAQSVLKFLFAAGVIAAMLAGPVCAGTLEDANAAYERKDFIAALKLYRLLADHGDAAAQNAIGKMYELGQGVPRDNGEALKFYRKAADQGYGEAQVNVGAVYEQGKGVTQDYAEALKWYRKAAEQGNFLAQNDLGSLYAKGQGVPRDDTEAATWYRKAADQGLAPAQNNLGAMYANGQGVPKDDAEAVKWYRRAAIQGYGGAQTNLGLMYVTGQGVKQDFAEALKLFKKAADQGLAIAQYQVGLRYYKGEGVPQNYAEASQWFKVAAEQGYDVAQFQIGNMYALGQGIAQSDVEAEKWHKIAANQGNAEAKKVVSAEGPQLVQNLNEKLQDIMNISGANGPGATNLRQCKIKGFYPGMTGKEYSDNFFGQLTKEQKGKINLKQPETLAMAACASPEYFTKFKQISKGISLYYNQPDNFVRFIYQTDGYDACCNKKDPAVVIPYMISKLILNADNATLEQLAKDFSNTYKISMELFDDKSGSEAISYRYLNAADGCQIDIKKDLSINITAIPKSGTAGTARAGGRS